MAPVAFGTQTGGSVLRPAAYCGVFGFKPTYNAFNRRGVFPAAESLDTLGLMARSLDDIELVSDVLELRPAAQPVTLTRAPRIGLCRTPLWNTAQPETAAAVEDAAARLGKAGAQVKEIELPEEFSGLRNAARETINNYERAAAMAHEWNTQRDAHQRAAAQAHRDRPRDAARRLSARRSGSAKNCRARLGDVFDGCDVLLAPAVQRRGAGRPRRDRRSGFPGDLDHPARAGVDAADASRAERHAGRHPAGGAAARRPPAVRLRPLGLAAARRPEMVGYQR